MPYWQTAYLDGVLNDLREDHRGELAHLLSFERLASPEPLIQVAEISTSGPRAETVNISTATSRISMEGIPRYTNAGGGLSQRQFKQDAKAVYNKMLRDPQEHLIVGFGQWEFITLMGPRLGGEARTVHALFMETWDIENEENPHALEAVDAERRRQLWRLYRRDNATFLMLNTVWFQCATTTNYAKSYFSLRTQLTKE